MTHRGNEQGKITGVGRSRSRLGLGLGLGAWFALVTVPLSYFSAAHLATLPVAETSLSSVENSDAWRLIHVVSENCPCSRSVVRYLSDRGAVEGAVEEIVALDGSQTLLEALRGKGFLARAVEAEGLCQSFGVEGVPFFQVVDALGEVRYSGSYFVGMARRDSGFLDLETLAAAQGGHAPSSRPVFGCPTSDRLKTRLDPFKLKEVSRF